MHRTKAAGRLPASQLQSSAPGNGIKPRGRLVEVDYLCRQAREDAAVAAMQGESSQAVVQHPQRRNTAVART